MTTFVEIANPKFRRSLRIERLTGNTDGRAMSVSATIVHNLGTFELLLEANPTTEPQGDGVGWAEDVIRGALLDFAEAMKQAALEPLVKKKLDP